MTYLNDLSEVIEKTIGKLKDYLNDEKAYTKIENLDMAEVVTVKELQEVESKFKELTSMKKDLVDKYRMDAERYKDDVLHSRRIAKIIVDKDKHRVYKRKQDNSGYSQIQNTYYNFVMEVATENGIPIVKDKTSCRWQNKHTKQTTIEGLKRRLNRMYFVDEKDIEIIEK